MKKTISILLGASVLSTMVTSKGQYSSFDNDGCDTDNINFGIDEGKQFDTFGDQACNNSNALKAHDDYLGFNNKSCDNVGKATASCGDDSEIFNAPSKNIVNVNKAAVYAKVAAANDEVCGQPSLATPISKPVVSAPAQYDCGTETVSAPVVRAPIVRAPVVENIIVKGTPVATGSKTENNSATVKGTNTQDVSQTNSAKQVQVATKNLETKTNLKNNQTQKQQAALTIKKQRKDDESLASSDDAESNHSNKSAAAQAGEHSGSIELVKDVAKEGGMEYVEKHANCGGFKDGEIDTEDIEVKEHVKAIRHQRCGEKVDKKKWLKRSHHKKCFHEKHGNLKKERCVKGSGKDCNKFNLNRCQGNKDEAHKGKESKDLVKVMKDYKMSDLESEVNSGAACSDNSVSQEVNNTGVSKGSVAASNTKCVEQGQKVGASKTSVVKGTVDNCDN